MLAYRFTWRGVTDVSASVRASSGGDGRSVVARAGRKRKRVVGTTKATSGVELSLMMRI